ncbi:MAG: aminotransferase class III-fold pyridoxal phosphate-dependent enzyme [Pseudomonadales bacterium]|jgi:glutamate-1-semialdehyde 2,1-aminomutase|nr:aminotransferase class III-fold pyridoxal phosphate-dependent enzyme [Pseudomonadales bacterium]
MSDADDAIDGPRGRALWARADRVLPGGGIYHTRSADMAGRGVLPGFIAEARGCEVVDADGRRYVDWLCANGPNLLGYLHPEVEAAVAEERMRTNTASLFPPALVDVVEALVARFPPMAWGVVAKNGSEVVSLAARVARQHTQRRRLLTFERAYHGNDPELASSPRPGVLTDGTELVDRLPWNDPQALLDHAETFGEATAAIIVNPLDQGPLVPTTAASQDFVAAMHTVRERFGVALILDSVRHGFRLHPDGCQHAIGLEPDLLTLGKALGNGHAISAVLGVEGLRKAARRMLFTSTYMFESPPMRAATKVLEIYDRDDVFAHLEATGRRLCEGLRDAAAEADQRVVLSGPPTMPSLLFADDGELAKGRAFCRAMAAQGVLWHPLLNHFVSAAHGEAAVQTTLAAARAAFIRLSERESAS